MKYVTALVVGVLLVAALIGCTFNDAKDRFGPDGAPLGSSGASGTSGTSGKPPPVTDGGFCVFDKSHFDDGCTFAP